MEATRDRTEQAEQAGECYEAARDWLAFLIDHPDKTVSASEYRAQLEGAQAAVGTAHDAMMASARG